MMTSAEWAIQFLEERLAKYDAAIDAHQYGNLSASEETVAGWLKSRDELISVIIKIKSGVLT